jgi:hypothetical protein
MQRRTFVAAGLGLPLLAQAHHGWSSFDQNRPIWLEGRATQVSWRNPHAELKLEVAPDLKLPTDLATRKLPAQVASVDGPALLKAAQLPTRKDRVWEIELAPLTRMDAWRVPEIKPGTTLALLGFTFSGEKGGPVLRAEYLFLAGQVYGLRSGPG